MPEHASLPREDRSPPVDREPTTATDVVAAVAFTALVAPVAARTLRAVDVGDLPVLLAGALLGIVATDFTSGLVHWLCDTFFAEDTPVLGRALIQPFREHHRDPLAMTRRGLLRGNRSNFIVMAVALALIAWRRHGAPGGTDSRLADAGLLAYAVAVVLTNQFHKWAHAPRVPRVVGWLQAARLVVSPLHHAVHHQSDHGRAFCVTTGWLNPLLDRSRVFALLEHAAVRLGGGGPGRAVRRSGA